MVTTKPPDWKEHTKISGNGAEITAEDVLAIHDGIIQKFGGISGVLNHGTIDHLIYKMSNKKDVFLRTTLALHIIITNHPFMDGNKRTAFAVADIILRSEQQYIHTEKLKILGLLLKIGRYECTVTEIEKWLRIVAQPSHIR